MSYWPFELSGIFEITVDLKEGSDPAEVDQIISDELATFLANGPTADELKRAKTKYLAGRLRSLEQIGGFGGKATALAQGELYAGDAGFFKKSLDWLNMASPNQVKEASEQWLSQGYYQATMKPEPKFTVAESVVDRSKGLPEVGGLPDLEFPAIEETTLSNGVKLVVANRTTVPMVSMAVQFDAGYAADVGRPLGTSSFALSMMDEGTESRSALEISAEAESLGAAISTGNDLDMSLINLSATHAR